MSELARQLVSTLVPVILMKNHGEIGFWFQLFNMLLTIMAMTAIDVAQQHNMKKYIRSFFHKNNCSFKCTAKLFYKNNRMMFSDIPISFYALQKMLHDKITKDQYQLSNNRIQYHIENLYMFNKKLSIVCFHYKYEISTGIFIEQVEEKKENTGKDSTYTCVSYAITLTSIDNKYKTLQDFVQQCEAYHDEENIDQHKLFVLSNQICDTDYEFAFDEFDFSSNKTFNNMFFYLKQEIIKSINYFTDNEAVYKRLGIPYTLGFMFHGAPGTGKTSIIKAIANYTKRHIIVIPLGKIKNIETLKKIFHQKQILTYTVPNSKRLYVFEEIDCGDWQHILYARDFKNNKQDTTDQVSSKESIANALAEILSINYNNTNTSDSKRTSILSCKQQNTTITLGEVLELLDGVVEMHGRMIIMTSNYPSRIDPALLRPGRMDMVVEIKNMRRVDIASMYELWFNDHIPNDVFNKLQDFRFSQAEIGNIFASHNIKKIHQVLTTNNQM
jgi:hypothetical protein